MNKIIREARDDEFSFNRLRIMPYNDRVDYCYEHLGRPIGSGSSRLVFQIDDEWVLKLAMNKAGAAQNEAEIPDEYQKELSIFARVDEQRSDLKDYYWIVSEYVIPLESDKSDEDVYECTNGALSSFDDLCYFILQSASQYDEWAKNKMMSSIGDYDDDDDDAMTTYFNWDDFEKFMEKSDVLRDINDYLTNTQFNGMGDWLREENVGMALRNGNPSIVFLDSGFNREIGRKYYGWFASQGTWDDSNENIVDSDMTDIDIDETDVDESTKKIDRIIKESINRFLTENLDR